VLLALTVLLNVVLTTLIIVKLIGARRAARVFGAVQTASSYSDIIAIVVESALAWVLAICLGVIFNTNGFQNTPVGLLFNSISENISVSWGRRYGVR
jgi:phage-related holin